MWVVEAQDVNGVGYYTYLVDAPQDTSENAVATCAYAKHGQLYRDGKVDAYLGPSWIAFWQQTVDYDEGAYI